MAARWTEVTIRNNTRLNLRKVGDNLPHGVWDTRPPILVGPEVTFASESDGFLTGTEGIVIYDLETVDGSPRSVGRVTMHWNNPFIGGNGYDESVTPTATRESPTTGFSVVHTGGNGNDARVTFSIFNGFVETDADHTEIIDSVSQPLETGSMATPRYAAIWAQRGGPPFQARHGLNAEAYQQTFDQMLRDGFRLVRVSGAEIGGQDRYAAIWEQRDGPAWQARHGLTAEQYQQTFDQLLRDGFRPVHVSAHNAGGQDRYAAIWEQQPDAPAWQARHGLTAQAYQQTFDQMLRDGFRLVHVSGHQVGGQDRYAAIWEQRDGPAWQARHGLSADQYQQTFDQLLQEGFRLVQVSGYEVDGEDRYAAIWEQEAGGAWQARHCITEAHYQQTFDQLVRDGFALTCVSVYPIR